MDRKGLRKSNKQRGILLLCLFDDRSDLVSTLNDRQEKNVFLWEKMNF